MQQVMTSDTQYERLPSTRNHESLPWCFSLVNICQFPHMMHFEVAFFRLTVFTFSCFHPLQEFSTRCKLKSEHRKIHSCIFYIGTVYIPGMEQLTFLHFSIPSWHSHRHISSTVECGRYFMHSRLMLCSYGFQEASLCQEV